MLPNPNPSGAATSDMVALSFQESTMYAVQSIDENIRGLRKLFASFLKVNTENLKLDKKQETAEKINRARERATAAEEKRESKFGTTLKSAATGVKDKAIEVGKGISLGGVLSTLLGGALLAAFFAPEKFDKIVQSIKEKVEEYGPSIMGGIGNYLSQLNFSDLVVTGILGVRGGIIFSLFKFAGNWLKEKLEGWLGTSFDGWFGENAGEIAGAAGLFATLMPGTTIKLITGLYSSSGSLIKTGLERAQKLLPEALGKGLTPKALGIAGIAVAAGMMAKTAVNGIADWFTKKDFSEEANTAMGKSMTGLQEATPALAKVGGQALEFAAYGAALGSVFPVIGTAIGAAIGGLVGAVVGIFSLDDAEIQGFKDGMSKIWDAIIDGLFSGVANLLTGLPSWALPDGVKSFIEKYSDTQGMKEQEATEKVEKTEATKNKRLEKYGTTEEEIASVMNENGMVDDKKLYDLNKKRKAEKKDRISSVEAAGIFRSTQRADKAKQNLEEVKAAPAKELEEIDNQILEKQNWVEEAKNRQKENKKQPRGELIAQREQEIEELSKRREKLTRGNDASPIGGTGNDTLNETSVGGKNVLPNVYKSMLLQSRMPGETVMMAPTFQAGSPRMNSLEAEMVSMNNATKPQAPIVIASPSSSSPTSVDQSQTIINNSNRQTTISGGISQYTQSPTRSVASRFSAA